GMSDTHAAEKSGRRRIFFGWYMVAASIVTNTIFSAAYFQGFGVLMIPIERTFGWDRWVISAAMSLRQFASGIVRSYRDQHDLLRRLFPGLRRSHDPNRTHLRLGPLGYFSRNVAAPVGVRYCPILS